MFILLPIAFFSGILTALSPCVLPILPLVLGIGADGDKKRIHGLLIGIIASFTLFSLTLASLVAISGIPADWLRLGAGWLLAIFGLSLVFPSIWNGFQGILESHLPQTSTRRSGFTGGLLTGGILGLVWTPCVGPILAAVTTLAALQTFSWQMVIITLAYAVGIGLMLAGFAYGGQAMSSRLGWYKKNQDQIRRWFGIILLATALLILTGWERRFQSWVLDVLPPAIANPVETFESRFDIKDRLPSPTRRDRGRSNSGEVVNQVSLKLEADGAKIPLSEIHDGCPVMDCIPSIDEPVFKSMTEAGYWMRPEDTVFVLNHKDITKIYAQRILNWHEIVNDWFGDDPIMVTFCPLCGTAVAFERTVDSTVTQFGVSGKLHNSDLIMYDRLEGSLWQQITGEAISGPAARRDELLKQFFLITMTWEQALENYDSALVLSRDTGFRRDYDRYPYGNYEVSGDIYFPVSHLDESLPPKTWVYGIEVNDQAKAYVESTLPEGTTIQDKVGGDTIEITHQNGVIFFKNLTSDTEIIPLRSFWFAWSAFKPETELY